MAFASQKKQVRSRNNRGGDTTCEKTQGEYRKTPACADGEQRPYLGDCKGPEGKWHRHTSKRGACVSLRLQNWSILLQLATYTGNPRMGLPVDHRVIRWPKGRDVLSALLRCRARGGAGLWASAVVVGFTINHGIRPWAAAQNAPLPRRSWHQRHALVKILHWLLASVLSHSHTRGNPCMGKMQSGFRLDPGSRKGQVGRLSPVVEH
jgi:hypothetical protein